MDFAFLSHGRIIVKEQTGPARQIESKFGASVRQRALDLERRNAWKTGGRGAQFMRGGAIWGASEEARELPIVVTGISCGCAPGELIYSLGTDQVSGVFVLRNNLSHEQRLLHTADFRVCEISGNALADKIAFVLAHPNGTSTLGVMRSNGEEMAEVTQGDALNMAPRWIPCSNSEIVYQSAGIARNQAGLAVGRGPFVIEKLDIESGNIETLAEEESFDLLAPQVSPAGDLWFIRRPYTPPNARIHTLRLLLDFILLPFRLLFAVFQFLNVFSAKYTGKFLTNASGARQGEVDPRHMMIWGNLVEAEKRRRNSSADEAPALVPGTWQLVRKSTDGTSEVVAKNVISFDIEADGALLYSNGSAVFRRSAVGRTDRLERSEFIQQVVSLSTPSKTANPLQQL